MDLVSAGLREHDFPSRVVVDSFTYTSVLNKKLRVASFCEWDGWNTSGNPSTVKDLKQQVGRLFPPLRDAMLLATSSPTTGSDGGTPAVTTEWALPKGMQIRTGLRPFVFDGRLILGKIPQYQNLYVNVGPGFTGEYRIS